MSWQRGTEEDRIDAEREGWRMQGKAPTPKRRHGAANQESMGPVSWIIGVAVLIGGIYLAWWLFNHFNAGQ